MKESNTMQHQEASESQVSSWALILNVLKIKRCYKHIKDGASQTKPPKHPQLGYKKDMSRKSTQKIVIVPTNRYEPTILNEE